MESKESDSTTVDKYISSFPENTQAILQKLRKLVKEEVPQAEEKMAYGMPTYKLEKNLVHFAGYAKHIGFYPTPDGIEEFKEELDKYKNAKGSVQFPLDREIPFDLIRRIVKYRVEQEKAK